ncbi:MAG: peptidase M14 family protein, partial [Longimicrobiales bacterium]
MRPYDLSTDNFAEFMGVRVDPVGTPVEGGLSVVSSLEAPAGTVAPGTGRYVLDGRLNDAFHAVNLLFDAGADLRRVDAGGLRLNAGDFVVTGGISADAVAGIAAETGVDFKPLSADVSAISHPLERQRIGMYQRYYGGNMDEGWTRLLLEDFGFPYSTLMDADILEGNLRQRYDVIILPADRKTMMTGITAGGGGGEYSRYLDPSSVPPEYRSGFGAEGVEALEEFVKGGGTLMTFAEAGDLPIDEFHLSVRNVLSGAAGSEFWAPGSTLKVKVDNTNPFAYGMPSDALALFLAGGQVYETLPGPDSEGVERIVTYVERNVLQSGWLLGEEVIADKAAVVSVEHGEGTVYLIGFRAQHRHQTHGTYKLVFNALVNGVE